MHTQACRFCAEKLTETFADLGMSPLSNTFLRPSQANAPHSSLRAKRSNPGTRRTPTPSAAPAK